MEEPQKTRNKDPRKPTPSELAEERKRRSMLTAQEIEELRQDLKDSLEWAKGRFKHLGGRVTPSL